MFIFKMQFSIYSHPRNITQAVAYFKKGIEINGDPQAQHFLGTIYSTGIGGVEKDTAMVISFNKQS